MRSSLRGAARRVVVADLGGEIDGSGPPSPDPADEVVREIQASGGDAVACCASVADEAGATNIVGTALEAFGRLDAVVNNAGDPRLAPLRNVDPRAVPQNDGCALLRNGERAQGGVAASPGGGIRARREHLLRSDVRRARQADELRRSEGRRVQLHPRVGMRVAATGHPRQRDRSAWRHPHDRPGAHGGVLRSFRARHESADGAPCTPNRSLPQSRSSPTRSAR